MFSSDPVSDQFDYISPPAYSKNMKNKVEKILSYFAVFDPAEEGGYNVSFPDFPGCVTFGKTFEESKQKAQEVLELWLEELTSQRKAIPIKSSRPIIDEVKVASPRKFPIPA